MISSHTGKSFPSISRLVRNYTAPKLSLDSSMGITSRQNKIYDSRHMLRILLDQEGAL
jgi:hypothetical protein